MQPEPTSPETDPAALSLSDLMAKHGARWSITADHEHHVVVAIRRPTPTAERCIVAFTPEELDDKLDAVTSESVPPGGMRASAAPAERT